MIWTKHLIVILFFKVRIRIKGFLPSKSGILNKIVAGASDILGVELDAGVTRLKVKLDSAIQNRADASWRPDLYQKSSTKNQETEIKEYITDISEIINISANDLEELLTSAEGAVR